MAPIDRAIVINYCEEFIEWLRVIMTDREWTEIQPARWLETVKVHVLLMIYLLQRKLDSCLYLISFISRSRSMKLLHAFIKHSIAYLLGCMESFEIHYQNFWKLPNIHFPFYIYFWFTLFTTPKEMYPLLCVVLKYDICTCMYGWMDRWMDTMYAV